MKKSLIVICGLVDEFNSKVASVLCDKLAMFLLNIQQMMEFELSEKDDIIEKCGLDYYYNLEKKLIKTASTYENTVVLMNYDYYTFGKNYEVFKNTAYTFFLHFDKKELALYSKKLNVINKLAFEDRNEILKENCDFMIQVTNNNVEETVNNIILQLKEATK